MVEEIKINHEELLEEAQRLHNAIEVFRPYCDEYWVKIVNSLEDGNSDFITEVQKTLKNMRDTIAPSLVIELENIEKKVEEVATSFKQLDSKLANTIEQTVGGNKDGL
ncbi:MAG: hypothetical protein R3Y54_10675 [Eubacteriales bacterium]